MIMTTVDMLQLLCVLCVLRLLCLLSSPVIPALYLLLQRPPSSIFTTSGLSGQSRLLILART